MVLSYGVLSGDQQGQVNFLFLLIVFVFLPVLALVLSVILLLRRGGRGVSAWLLELPIWPTRLKTAAMQISNSGASKHWFIYHSQLFGVAFSLGCLSLYFLLLLTTDITFVWRSTLLEAEQLYPSLRVLALPWAFWPEAQPSLALLEQSRDFRLEAIDQPAQEVGQWWRYVFAAQLAYALLPRSVMLAVARHRYRQEISARRDAADNDAEARPRRAESALELAEVVHDIEAPYLLLAWGSLPEAMLVHTQSCFGEAELTRQVGPFEDAIVLDAEGPRNVLMAVKSWEPPLAELGDFLATVTGFEHAALLPLDWQGDSACAVKPVHLNEWRRFCATLPGWKVLQKGEGP